ncbi:MAG: hypothetical protein ACKV2T_39225 [Kofleriaceae bacterium]
MRVLAVAGLVVVALGVALWLLIMRDDDTQVVPDAKAAPAKTEEAPTAPLAEMPARKVENVGAEIGKAIAAQRAKDDRAAPSLAAETAGSGSGSARVTPEDHLRWSLMRAVHTLEPAIIECMDAGRKNGESFSDSIASYGFIFSKKGEEIVFDEATLEYGPFSDATNACIKNAGKTMALERMPEGATRVKIFSKLTVQKGDIMNVQMPSFHVLETGP